MKMKILCLMLAVFLMVNLVNAELYLWETQNIDTSASTVSDHGFYQLEDTSARGIGKNKDTDITLVWTVQALPFNLTGYGGEVDWCNFTVKHYHNIYGTQFVAFEGFKGGELLNTTTIIFSNYSSGTPLTTGSQTFSLRDRDRLEYDMKCHYTNSSTLYVESFLAGRVTTYFDSFECDDCSEYSLEELSNEIERTDEIITEQTEIYENIQSVIDMNYRLWLIASYLVKIAFIIVAISLVFMGIYYIYKFFKDIEEQIR